MRWTTSGPSGGRCAFGKFGVHRSETMPFDLTPCTVALSLDEAYQLVHVL